MSSGLTAKVVPAEHLGRYDRLASAYGSIFDTVRWTSMFGSGILRIGLYDPGDNLRGGFCLAEQRRFGLKVLRGLPLTPQIGPFFEPHAANAAARTTEQRDAVLPDRPAHGGVLVAERLDEHVRVEGDPCH